MLASADPSIARVRAPAIKPTQNFRTPIARGDSTFPDPPAVLGIATPRWPAAVLQDRRRILPPCIAVLPVRSFALRRCPIVRASPRQIHKTHALPPTAAGCAPKSGAPDRESFSLPLFW